MLLDNLFRSVPRPDDSAIGWGVTDGDFGKVYNYKLTGLKQNWNQLSNCFIPLHVSLYSNVLKVFYVTTVHRCGIYFIRK
ncbi:hypothetical protein HanPSC8_Chr11g0484171 [Helianthus annuus]|nr:hypothetical protein HanPSC8_Chr11g0484171 [Helianthus annuus]